ncbi:MAG: hypothetical protein L3J75_01390 [Methylococcaceae bacterium]|nr:hypothetical protein [Methylococcaceae bacterium]
MIKNTINIIQKLNPADCFTLAMDEEIRQEGMPGSLCGFALELSITPDIEALSVRIEEFIRNFPLSTASLQQRGKQFYWCKRESSYQTFFHHPCSEQEDEELFHCNIIDNVINHLEPRETIAPIEFHLITGNKKNVFLLRWIHPFCDARGADLILKYLCTESESERQLFDLPKTESLVNLQLKKYKWWQKISLFIKGKRYIEQLDQLQSIIHAPQDIAPEKLSMAVFRLSEEQTQTITALSRKHVGLTGTSLYYIGCFMRALNKIEPEKAGDAYCVPYAFNLRKQKSISPVLGNHVCALFAQAPRTILNNREKLFNHLKQQNMNVIRQKLDYAFLPIMWAASWLSLKKHGEHLRQSFRSNTERSSFWFSDIGTPDLSGHPFFNADITQLFHLCQVTSPPGLALLNCQYNKQLTLSYNYIEPLFNKKWIEKLHKQVVKELLEIPD